MAELFGVKITDDGAGEFGTFTVEEILYVDLWAPKRNYQVPRFHTVDATYTVLLTLDACRRAFPDLLQLDSGNLVNTRQIQFVTETAFALTAHFRGGKTANVARNKRAAVEHLIKRDRK
ncbi:dipeptidyl aminopeptidase [Saccharibacillus sp. CPCC 101409]|uniref:dipeptidyl aminopeptidase n=1 Tax=Saccharibacillus sp. CPCC 101409 TaxID=3058041 RepID=UPI0026731C7C|nr:dipeptidyl aminopeptidase [Saccharibacillus sp. CPCC 101409]MDO3408835.1 dipeptidyl aminopeptidase [Saccharibacillus sp. CPCC 101409]